jgi:hypothetical protein
VFGGAEARILLDELDAVLSRPGVARH